MILKASSESVCRFILDFKIIRLWNHSFFFFFFNILNVKVGEMAIALTNLINYAIFGVFVYRIGNLI